MKAEYPKALYHATEEARVVANPIEHDALGPEWAESPGEALEIGRLKADSEPVPAAPVADIEPVSNAVAEAFEASVALASDTDLEPLVEPGPEPVAPARGRSGRGGR